MGGGRERRTERLRGLEWREVEGVMSASPRGLLSDRDMVYRLRLGCILQVSRTTAWGRRYLPIRSDLEHKTKMLFIVIVRVLLF